MLHILQTIEELEDRGISVQSLKPGEQLEGVTGKLVRNIMASIAQWSLPSVESAVCFCDEHIVGLCAPVGEVVQGCGA